MTRTVRLAADEIGLGYGRLGEFLLRSEAQPVFRRRGSWLRPEGAAIRTMARRRNRAIRWDDFLAALSDGEQAGVEAACRQLDVENHIFVSDDQVELLLGPVHEGCPDQPGPGEPTDPFGDPGPVYCPLSARQSRSDAELERRAEQIRAAGMRVCLTDFASRGSVEACLSSVGPEMVRIDSAWSAHLAADSPLCRLLAQLVERLHVFGAEALLERIDDRPRLAAALGAGVDLLAGDALAPHAPVGSAFAHVPLDVAVLTAADRNIIPLALPRQGRGRR